MTPTTHFRRVGGAALVAALLLIAPACGSGSGATAGEDTPVRIGYIGALTGASATMGAPGQRGIQLAIQEANADGGIDGRPIELAAFDDQADPTLSVSGAQGFIRENDVAMVIGGPNSPTVLANREVLSSAGIVELIAIASEDSLVDPEHPSFPTTFRVTEPNAIDVEVMAEYVRQQGCQSVGILADNTAYGQGGIDTISRVFADVDIEVGAQVTHPPAPNDMTSEVLALRDSGVDCVYVFSLGQPAALYFEAAAELGYDAPAFGGRGLNQSSFLDLVGDRSLPLTLVSIANPEDPEYADFVDRYIAEFDEEAWYMFPALGYDTGRVAVEALRRSGGEGGEALVDALENLTEFPVVVGQEDAVVSFGPDDHEGGGPAWVVMVTVENGEFVKIDDQPQLEGGQ